MHGHVDRVTRNCIMGWAGKADSPEQAVELSVLVNGRQAGRIIANQQSNNLCNVFSGATGKYAFRYDFDPPLSLFTTQHIEIIVSETSERLPNGQHIIGPISIGGNLNLASPTSRQTLTPILVTSAGRSGSSLFMARLRSHPQIIVAGDHPYEVLLLTYYALAFRTLVSQADRERSADPDTMLAAQHRYHTGFNPFNDRVFGSNPQLAEYWNDTVPSSLGRAFGKLVSDYYEVVTALTKKSQPIYLAEKSKPNADIRRAAQVMFGLTKEIVLIRDPRDLLCSMKSFWKTDTTSAIGNISSQMDYLRRLRDSNAEHTLFIKYEDVVLNAEETMRRVHTFLGLSNPIAHGSGSEGAVFSYHGTSASPSQSVGRWRSDLSAEEIETSRTKFATILESFEYKG